VLDPDKAIPFGQHGDINRLGNSFSLSSGHPHQKRGHADEGFGHFGEVLPWQGGYRRGDGMTSKKPNEIDSELDALTREYAAWNKAQGLDLGSADEHLFDETLTEGQREWLRDFSRRWEDASPVHAAQGIFRRRDL
jgi:hypothetical protein